MVEQQILWQFIPLLTRPRKTIIPNGTQFWHYSKIASPHSVRPYYCIAEQLRCFKCSTHSKSGAKFHPPVGTCLRHVMEAPPQKHHTLYIQQRSLYIAKEPPSVPRKQASASEPTRANPPHPLQPLQPIISYKNFSSCLSVTYYLLCKKDVKKFCRFVKML